MSHDRAEAYNNSKDHASQSNLGTYLLVHCFNLKITGAQLSQIPAAQYSAPGIRNLEAVPSEQDVMS